MEHDIFTHINKTSIFSKYANNLKLRMNENTLTLMNIFLIQRGAVAAKRMQNSYPVRRTGL